MKTEINTFIKGRSTFNELDLFREIQNYLSKKYICTFIEETHQKQVEFKSILTNCVVSREISDLWIITYSQRNKKAKMTFLQAKYEKNKNPITIPFSFTGDYFQFELLSQRPKITDKSSFKFPTTILSNSVSDSVGSFGVFYRDYKNRIDFSFSIASDLKTKSNANFKTKNKKLYFKESVDYSSFSIVCKKNRDLELRSTLNADCFESSLLNMYIGTPIEDDKYILNFLRAYFEKKKEENISDFLLFLTSIGAELTETITSLNDMNILLINVDRKG
jgi:hypothetical protein